MIHILQIVQSLEKGGRTKYISELEEQLRRSNNKVTVVSFSEPPEDIRNHFDPENKWVVLKKKYRHDLPLLIKLIQLILKEQVDVVHCHSDAAFLYGGIAAKLTRTPVVGTYHRSELKYYRPHFKQRFMCKLLDKIIAVSNQRSELVIYGLGSRSDKVLTIHGAVDACILKYTTGEAQNEEKIKLGIDLEELMILGLGHLGVIKGHDASIIAVSLLKEKGIPVKLYIAGDGSKSDYHRLNKLIIEKKIESNVILLGQVFNPMNWLSACDIFVQPSVEEALGLVFLEAGALGKPVVATNIGGIPEVVVDGETGYLVEVNNYRGLAEKIEVLYRDKQKRFNFGLAGRKRVQSEFSIEKLLNQHMDLYNQLIKQC